jgi:hypothetical protein
VFGYHSTKIAIKIHVKPTACLGDTEISDNKERVKTTKNQSGKEDMKEKNRETNTKTRLLVWGRLRCKKKSEGYNRS